MDDFDCTIQADEFVALEDYISLEAFDREDIELSNEDYQFSNLDLNVWRDNL